MLYLRRLENFYSEASSQRQRRQDHNESCQNLYLVSDWNFIKMAISARARAELIIEPNRKTCNSQSIMLVSFSCLCTHFSFCPGWAILQSECHGQLLCSQHPAQPCPPLWSLPWYSAQNKGLLAFASVLFLHLVHFSIPVSTTVFHYESTSVPFFSTWPVRSLKTRTAPIQCLCFQSLAQSPADRRGQ